MKHVGCFCAKINHLGFVFLTVHMLHKSILFKFNKFMLGFLPSESNFESKKKTKSLTIIGYFFYLYQTFLIIQTCYLIHRFDFFLVLQLYQSINQSINQDLFRIIDRDIDLPYQLLVFKQ